MPGMASVRPSSPKPPLTDARKLRQAQKELRETRKALQGLSDSALVFLGRLDQLMRQPESRERGAAIAKLANAFEMVNDQVRYGPLGVDFRTDDKAKVLARLMKSEAG